MSYVDVIPAVRSLSRPDKPRLIQILADDLARGEDSVSNPIDDSRLEVEDNGHADDCRIPEAIPAMSLRNAIGREEGEGLDRSEPDGVETSNQGGSPPPEAGPTYPYWSPDWGSEAAAILMRMLEEEKSAS